MQSTYAAVDAKGGGSQQLYYHDCSGRIPGHTTRAGNQRLPVLCHCQLGQDIPLEPDRSDLRFILGNSWKFTFLQIQEKIQVKLEKPSYERISKYLFTSLHMGHAVSLLNNKRTGHHIAIAGKQYHLYFQAGRIHNAAGQLRFILSSAAFSS